MKYYLVLLLSILFAISLTASAEFRPGLTDYDPGPSVDPNPSSIGADQKALIDLHSEIPSFPEISEQVMRYSASYGGKMGPTQKFRPAFGPIPWRMIMKPNSVKILFIGQDGTHIAEAAGRPATAGFGGRAHSLAKYFGVEYSAGFINTYAFTIKGQYGARGAPFVRLDHKNQPIHKGEFSTKGTIIPNGTWLMSQDQNSPIVQWRNQLIEWIINNNRDSLKMIVLFGGSAKDSLASFIESNGGKVGSYEEENMDKIQVPLFNVVPAGGNNEASYPVNASGKDIYAEISGKKINYKKGGKPTVNERNQKEAIKQMIFTKAGPYNNGLLHHAQMGGYNLNEIYVDKRHDGRRNKITRSIKGLKLKSGKIETDILVVALPHPTSLTHTMNNAAAAHWTSELKDLARSGNGPAEAAIKKIEKAPAHSRFGAAKDALEALGKKYGSKFKKISEAGYREGKKKVADKVARDVQKLDKYKEAGWVIPADAGSENSYNAGGRYEYGREEIHNAYYDFGTPKNRMVSKSTAKRAGGQVILFGSRDAPKHDKRKMKKMKKQKPNQELDPGEMFVSRTRVPETRYVFDPGPSAKYAKLMKAFDREKLEAKKDGKRFSKDGISAYYVKNHPAKVGDFGHYRGTFHNPKVVIVADPDGFDDLITARALTGTRGQYLQGMMEDLGVNDQYLVIKTVPYGMDGATDAEWNYVLKHSEKYRENLLGAIIKDSDEEPLVIADGKYATQSLNKIFKKVSDKMFVSIKKVGLANDSGIKNAVRQIVSLDNRFSGRANLRMRNIPKSHLTYYARVWEGTSGDRILNATDKEAGLAFYEVAPGWAAYQKPQLQDSTKAGIKELRDILWDGGFIMPEEKLRDYLRRMDEAAEDDAA